MRFSIKPIDISFEMDFLVALSRNLCFILGYRKQVFLQYIINYLYHQKLKKRFFIIIILGFPAYPSQTGNGLEVRH